MTESKIVSLVLKGGAYEQGLQQGRALKEAIAKNAMYAKHLVEKVANHSSYKKFLHDNMSYMQANFPELEEEIKGLADGSMVPYEDLVTLNVPAYFMTEYFSQECSMILARGKATADGKTYVIKNRDMRAPIDQVMVKRIYPDQTMVSEITGIGTVTYPASGINGAGLGVSTTGFWSPKAKPDISQAASRQVFLNIHLLLRNCQTVDEAIILIKKLPVMNGLNVILADKDKACIVEITKDKIVTEFDEGRGILFRTNHYVSEELKQLNPEPSAYASTFMRRERIAQLLEESYGHIRFQDLFRILSDHKDGINGICRHPQGSVLAKTVSTTLFVIEDKELWTTLGNPCEALPHFSV